MADGTRLQDLPDATDLTAAVIVGYQGAVTEKFPIALWDTRYLQASAANEAIDDRVAALLAGSTGLTATYDDTGNLLTLSLGWGIRLAQPLILV